MCALRLASALVVLAAAAAPARAELLLYVGSNNGTSIERFDGITGAFVDRFALLDEKPLLGQSAFAYGPDGHFFVQSASQPAAVRRYDGVTGEFRDVFVPRTAGSEAAILFGADGHLYAAGVTSNHVNRYDGVTGAFLGQFVPPQPGVQSITGMRFGPDGHLYMHRNGVRRFDGQTGQFLGVFADTGGSTLGDILFGPDGHLYAVDALRGVVRRFDGQTGEFLGVFAGGLLGSPFGLAFGPDGDLYVTFTGADEVRRFDGATGEFRGVFARTANRGPTYLAFVDTAAVPEPAGLLLGLAGAAGLARARGRIGPPTRNRAPRPPNRRVAGAPSHKHDAVLRWRRCTSPRPTSPRIRRGRTAGWRTTSGRSGRSGRRPPHRR